MRKLFLLLETRADDNAVISKELPVNIRTSFHGYRKSLTFALTEEESGPLFEEYARLSIEFQRRNGILVAENRLRARLAQSRRDRDWTQIEPCQAYSLESPLHIRRRLGIGRYKTRDATKDEAVRAHMHADVAVGTSEAAVSVPNTRRASKATLQRLQDEMADEVREVTRLADVRLGEYERDMLKRNRQAFVTLQRPWDHRERKEPLLYLSELVEALTPATPKWREFNAALGLLEGAEQAMQHPMGRAMPESALAEVPESPSAEIPETVVADLDVGQAKLGVTRCRADVHVPLAPCNSLVEGRIEASSGTDVLTELMANLREADTRTAAAAPAG